MSATQEMSSALLAAHQEINRLRAGNASLVAKAIEIAERARLDRPERDASAGRRRCGDVIRWKMNNATIDQIIADLRALSEGAGTKDEEVVARP